MNAFKLALISAVAFSLAHAGTAFAQEQDQQHETHHEDAGALTADEAGGKSMGDSADDSAEASGMQATTAPADMMMCQPMMTQMMGKMGKGSMMSKMNMMGQGMSGGGKKGRNMMGRGKMDQAMMGPDGAPMAHAGFPKLISMEAIKSYLEKMIADNKRLKVGKIEPGGDFAFSAEITTVDGSLVHKMLIDRRDGRAWEID